MDYPDNSPVSNSQSLVNRIKYLDQKLLQYQHVIKLQENRLNELTEDAQLLCDLREAESQNVVWIWQGDGEDYPESMVSNLPVLMRAYQLRGLLKDRDCVVSAATQNAAKYRAIADPAIGNAALLLFKRKPNEACQELNDCIKKLDELDEIAKAVSDHSPNS
jgi:hypothetical protein